MSRKPITIFVSFTILFAISSCSISIDEVGGQTADAKTAIAAGGNYIPTNTNIPSYTATFTSTPLATITSTASRTPTETLTPTITPIAGASEILARCEGNGQGIYTNNIETREFNPVLEQLGAFAKYEMHHRDYYFLGEGISPDLLRKMKFPESWYGHCCFGPVVVSRDGNAVLVKKYGPYVTDSLRIFLSTLDNPSLIPVLEIAEPKGSQFVSWLSPTREEAIMRLPTTSDQADIYLIGLKNGTVRNLTEDQPRNAYGAKWSPDGEKIAYFTDEGIWIIYRETFEQIMIVPRGIGPDWSPDGMRIVYRVDDEIFTSNPSGEEQIKLEMDGDGNNSPFLVQWSPDGKYIVYWGNGGNEWSWLAYEIDSKTIAEMLTFMRPQFYSIDNHFDWSPDGKWFLGYVGRSLGHQYYLCNLEEESCRFFDFTGPNDSRYCSPAWWLENPLPIEP